MPRFVILEHNHPHLHWDIMLEAGELLRTWRLAEPPSLDRPVRAEALGEHRRLYLDYEGPVSRDRGQVKRWDAGTFSWEMDTPDRLEVVLSGQHCTGLAVLQRSASGEWELTLGD